MTCISDPIPIVIRYLMPGEVESDVLYLVGARGAWEVGGGLGSILLYGDGV